ncbi:response regulator [Desulfitobacterium sp.]|uniref:GAF domain-containing hybrid sensor histidine kinase/response regulator n=1 Tax=Desulfitobacterium sp. TaxID=49981 RepID=UPI002B218EEC|nr:response regulator [Desulfitobacterium sp.]MEA4903176.1 response regulator [Desulfitobacterium sp.]
MKSIIVLLQGITDLSTVANLFMNKISLIINAQMGVIYLRKWECNNGCVKNAGQSLIPLASYACDINLLKEKSIQLGKGIIGQCAQDHQTVLLKDIPKDYLKISSGLGEAPPQAILVLPIEFEGEVIAVLEFASLYTFTLFERKLLERIAGILGIALYSIAQQMQMKNLLEQSQSLTEELQIQSKELQLQHGELRSALEQLEKQYQESELKTQEIAKVSQFKSEFLANMSHELRTPLNSILILAQTLAENKKGGLTPKQVEYATTIHSAGKDLLDLINDILDLSKVESGKMNIILSGVNLEDLQKELECQFMPVADQKGLSFEIQISPELPKIITMDKAHVLQILKNLLANAFKFTERGSIQLKFYPPGKDTLYEEGMSEIPFLAVTVSDTGPGIPEEQQTLIFEAFRQVDGTISRKYGGTGLGLSISRQLAHLIGGTIKLKSKVGKGSIFTLYIPMVLSDIRKTELTLHDEITDPSQIPTEESKLMFVNPKPLEGKTILIVDDDISNVFALTSLLEAYKMNVLFAENGCEALEMLGDHSEIDLVLMDIMMPEMDGYKTMTAIRQIEKFKMLPIIAVTAKAMKNDREKCIEAGASDYIQKPVNTDQLLSVMQV